MRNSSTNNGSLWLDLLGAEVRFRDVGGYATRSIEAGDGAPVVLIHGIFGHAESWAATIVPLTDGRRVYAIDLLGHGLTAKPLLDYSAELFGDHVVAFLDAIGAERAHLVGHSLGGWVAGWLAVHRPDRVKSYTSVTGAGLPNAQPAPAPGAKPTSNVIAATRLAISAPTLDNIRETAAALMLDKSCVTEDFVQTRLMLFRQPGFRDVALSILDAFSADNRAHEVLTADQLASISCPTLFVWSDHNPAMSHAAAERATAVIADRRFCVIENSGHSPHVEQPTQFNQVLDGFLHSIGD